MTKKSIFAFCTDSVVRFDRSTNDEAYRIQCRGYECLSASASGGRMYMLLTRSGAEGIPLDVLSMREDTTADENVIAITDIADTVGCFVCGGRAVNVKNNTVTVYTAKGAVAESTAFDGTITGAEKLSENSLLLILGGEVMLFTIK